MNTVDPAFFSENIRWGYEQRKQRHFDKGEEPVPMVGFIHELIKGSNQIVHNRGKAMAYLSGKRKEGPVNRKAPHKYDVRMDPGQRRGGGGAGGAGANGGTSTNYSEASEFQPNSSKRMPPQPNSSFYFHSGDTAQQQQQNNA